MTTNETREPDFAAIKAAAQTLLKEADAVEVYAEGRRLNHFHAGGAWEPGLANPYYAWQKVIDSLPTLIQGVEIIEAERESVGSDPDA